MKKISFLSISLLILVVFGTSCAKKQEVIEPESSFEVELNRLANSPYGKLIETLPAGYQPSFNEKELNYEKVYLFKANDGQVSEFYKIKSGEAPVTKVANTRIWSGWVYASVKTPQGWTGNCSGSGIDCGKYDNKWIWFWSTN